MSSCELGSKQNMFRISEWNSKQISSSSPSILLSCESEAISNGFPSSLNCMFCRSIGCIKDEHVHDQQWSHTVQKPRSTLICFTTWKTFFLTTYGSSFMNSRFIILFISYHFIGCLIYCQNNSVWECGGGGFKYISNESDWQKTNLPINLTSVSFEMIKLLPHAQN